MSISEFERQSGIANGTLNNYKARDAEISSKNIEKISNRFGKEMQAAGYSVIDAKAFGAKGLVVVKDKNEETANFRPPPRDVPKQATPDPESIKDREALREIAVNLSGQVGVNLNKLQAGQEGIAAIAIEVLNLLAAVASGGSPDKEKKIREDFVRKYWSVLTAGQQEGIRADGGTIGRG